MFLTSVVCGCSLWMALLFAVPPSAAAAISVPHLSGIFVALDNTTAARSKAEWTEDLTAMKKLGIEFFVVRSVASGCTSGPESPWCAACPPDIVSMPARRILHVVPGKQLVHHAGSVLPTRHDPCCGHDRNSPSGGVRSKPRRTSRVRLPGHEQDPGWDELDRLLPKVRPQILLSRHY